METNDLIDIHGVSDEIKRGVATAWKFVTDSKLTPYRQGDSTRHFFQRSAVQKAWGERQGKFVPAKRRRRKKATALKAKA